MKQYRKLYIKVDSEHSAEFVASLDAALKGGWSRAHEAEERAGKSSIDDEFFYYVCKKRGKREAALVSLYRSDAETVYVSNVVPRDLSELSHEQYNLILQDFHDTVLSRLHPSFPIVFGLGSDELRIEDMMPPPVLRTFKHFSTLANHSTGSAHADDRERWYLFLIALHQNPNRLDGHTFCRWLIEVDHWKPKVAHRLVEEFEFAAGLMNREDDYRRRLASKPKRGRQ